MNGILQDVKQFCVVVAVITFIVSCGNDRDPESLIDSHAKFSHQAPPIVLFLAGNASCTKTDYLSLSKLDKKPMYIDGFKLIKPLEDAFNRPFNWVMGCYDLDRNLYYRTSEDPFTTHEATTNEFLTAVDFMWEKSRSSKGLIISHSYGAWLGLQVAGRLNRKFHGVYTIDPVNREKCRILKPYRCRYPGKNLGLSKYLLKKVSQNTDKWINFYQKNDWLIRSNKLDYAHKNSKHKDLSHREIDEHEPIWTDIKWSFYNHMYKTQI